MNAMPAVTRPYGSGIRPRHSGTAAALRLTRRGRMVAAAVAALLVTMVSLLAAGAAQATNHALPPGAVVQQIVDLNALSGDVVFAGQQLWVPRG